VGATPAVVCKKFVHAGYLTGIFGNLGANAIAEPVVERRLWRCACLENICRAIFDNLRKDCPHGRKITFKSPSDIQW
jgi:hypothetical protein